MERINLREELQEVSLDCRSRSGVGGSLKRRARATTQQVRLGPQAERSALNRFCAPRFPRFSHRPGLTGVSQAINQPPRSRAPKSAVEPAKAKSTRALAQSRRNESNRRVALGDVSISCLSTPTRTAMASEWVVVVPEVCRRRNARSASQRALALCRAGGGLFTA